MVRVSFYVLSPLLSHPFVRFFLDVSDVGESRWSNLPLPCRFDEGGGVKEVVVLIFPLFRVPFFLFFFFFFFWAGFPNPFFPELGWGKGF